MNDIIEIILEIILDGAIEAAGSKKVPVFLRVLLVAIILIFVAGLCTLIFMAGKGTGNTGLIIISLVLLIVFVFIVALKVKKRN